MKESQHSSIDMRAVVIALLIILALSIQSRISTYFAPIAAQPTPAPPAPAPIYYAPPVPTLYPTPAAQPQAVDQHRNDDHRICIFVVDCSQSQR